MANPGEGPLYVGVDVGTQCVRAGLFTDTGRLVAAASRASDVLEPEPDMYEQSSDNIWESCCEVVKTVVANVPKAQVRGIGFDATCSLVVLDRSMKPLTVSPTENNRWNIVMWLDHRAADQAKTINLTQHEELKFSGGIVSLEMEMPKLLWLKQNMKKQCWDKAGHFFDLPDFLSWRATGNLSRSLCTLVCKWGYHVNGSTQAWNDSFLKQIGLSDLIENGYNKIGNTVQVPGSTCGSGLTPQAAAELGLNPHTAVATSIIDAHAGALGTLGCKVAGTPEVPLSSRLAIVCGTSSCHICLNEEALFVPGVWGPYYSAMVPGLWMTEGGQSATGKLVDHVIESHSAYGWVKDEAESRNVHIHDVLGEVLQGLCKHDSLTNPAYLTKSLQVWPDFHGNRSPIADPTLKGMISGLTLDNGVESLAKLYLATIQALAYGTRHILESLRKHGHSTQCLYMCGGLRKNALFVQTHADVTGLPIVIPDVQEPVLLGSAMLAACASKNVPDVQSAMDKMGGEGKIVKPNSSTSKFHNKKYTIFLKMVQHQQECRTIMSADTDEDSH